MSTRACDGTGRTSSPTGRGALSREGSAYLGGLLATMGDFSALFNPFINSYKRLDPDLFVATRATWGSDTRNAACRVLLDGPLGSARVESRRPGADASPYLVAAGLLAGGLHGLRDGLDPGPPLRPGDDLAVAGAALPSDLRRRCRASRPPSSSGDCSARSSSPPSRPLGAVSSPPSTGGGRRRSRTGNWLATPTTSRLEASRQSRRHRPVGSDVGSTIAQILPLALGIVVSPLPVVAVILILVTPRGRANGLSVRRRLAGRAARPSAPSPSPSGIARRSTSEAATRRSPAGSRPSSAWSCSSLRSGSGWADPKGEQASPPPSG